MRTLRDLSVDIEKKLVVNSIDDAKLDTRLLISHVLKLDHIDYALNKNRIVSEKEYTVVMQLVAQRLKRVPMSQIFGEKEFFISFLELRLLSKLSCLIKLFFRIKINGNMITKHKIAIHK